jgi:predicted transcriptional regulator
MAISSISSNLSALAGPRSSASSEDTRTELQKRLDELQKQLAEVMKRIKAVQNSNASDKEKAQQIQLLNDRAATISGQIKIVISKQLQELKAS